MSPFFIFLFSDENIIGLDLQEVLPDNNVKVEKMLTANPPNILKRAKILRNENSVSLETIVLIHHDLLHVFLYSPMFVIQHQKAPID